MSARVVINLPKSHKKTAAFKRKYPNAKFYGATSLGSGRGSYLLPANEVNKNELKEFGATIARDQPFISQ